MQEPVLYCLLQRVQLYFTLYVIFRQLLGNYIDLSSKTAIHLGQLQLSLKPMNNHIIKTTSHEPSQGNNDIFKVA